MPRPGILRIVSGLRGCSCSASVREPFQLSACVGSCVRSAAASLAQELAGTGAGFKVNSCSLVRATVLQACPPVCRTGVSSST